MDDKCGSSVVPKVVAVIVDQAYVLSVQLQYSIPSTTAAIVS